MFSQFDHTIYWYEGIRIGVCFHFLVEVISLCRTTRSSFVVLHSALSHRPLSRALGQCVVKRDHKIKIFQEIFGRQSAGARPPAVVNSQQGSTRNK